MSRKPKTKRVYLEAPEGIKIKRYNVDGQVRFTAPFKFPSADLNYERLVAIHNGEKFTYIHPDFTK